MAVDSKCAMQMLKQGTGSFKRAKYINQGMLELMYTPTDELVADILTKPLVGWKFKYLLKKLLGWCHGEMMHDQHVTEEVCCVLDRSYTGWTGTVRDRQEDSGDHQ
jgi:hypothetical protein